MLAEAFSPKHTSAVCEGPISSDPLPVMKHKLFNRNQLRTTTSASTTTPVLSGQKRRFKPKPSILSARKAMKAKRLRQTFAFFLRTCFERFHFFFFFRNCEYRLACTRLQFFLEQAIGKFRPSVSRWILVIESSGERTSAMFYLKSRFRGVDSKLHFAARMNYLLHNSKRRTMAIIILMLKTFNAVLLKNTFEMSNEAIRIVKETAPWGEKF